MFLSKMQLCEWGLRYSGDSSEALSQLIARNRTVCNDVSKTAVKTKISAKALLDQRVRAQKI